MKNIHRFKTYFQSLAKTAKFAVQIFLDIAPPIEIKRASFPMPINTERVALEKAVRAFNQKKLGRAR